SLLIGRDSAISTVSPISQRLVSSWALKLRVRRSVRPYSRWRVTSSTSTTTVLFILLLATRPVFVRGLVERVSAMAWLTFRPRRQSAPADAAASEHGRCPAAPYESARC